MHMLVLLTAGAAAAYATASTAFRQLYQLCRQATKNRNLLAESTEGLDALAAESEGKITLRKVEADVPDALEVSPAEIKTVR